MQSVNIMYRCEDCALADKYGRDCKLGLMSPILLLIAGKRDCPNFKPKTAQQVEEQIKEP